MTPGGVAGRHILVEDRKATRLPYSRDAMASSMMVIGIEPELAYLISEEVEDLLVKRTTPMVGVEDLIEVATACATHHAGRTMGERYAKWVAARRVQRPIVVLLGGAPGSGKSTVAGGIGSRLRITAVMPTDAVREVMRQLVSKTLSPILHVSSFEAHRVMRAPVPEDHDAVVIGFQQQAEVVASGVRGLVNRAIVEGSDLIVEGVHVLPGVFADDLAEWRRHAVVCHAVLAVPDPEQHRAHFLTRLERSPSRRPHRYLDAFPEVRRIHRYVSMVAESHGVPQLVMDLPDETIQTVVQMVVDAVIEAEERDVSV